MRLGECGPPDLAPPDHQSSLFLFGPRQVGKSTLLRRAFPDASYADLLEADRFRELWGQGPA